MNSRLLYIFSLIGLFTAFWACGDGDIYTYTAEDEIAVEKLGKLSDEELEALMDECRADAKCRAEMEKYPELSSSSETAVLPSSSEGVPESSSKEESSSSVESSATDTLETSSSAIPKSSSSKVDEKSSSSEASAQSSSEKAKDSSSSAEILSSSEENESSSSEEEPAEESSSSEPEQVSSSSEPAKPESSSSVESSSSMLPPHGTCTMKNSQGTNTTVAKLNEPVTWTYIPDEGTSVDGSFRWNFDVEYSKIAGSVTSFTFKVKFTDNGGGEAYLSYNNGAEKACSVQMKVSGVYDATSSSSENGDTPVDPDSSPSTRPSSSSGKPGICEDDDCDDDPPPPSSSSENNPIVESSSSSENGGNSGNVQSLTDFGAQSGFTLQPGTYRVESLANGASSRMCDVKASSDNIRNMISFPEGSSGQIQVWNDHDGQARFVPSTEITVTSGELKSTNCW